MNVFNFLIKIIKDNKWLFFFFLFVASIARIADILLPLFFKLLIDSLNTLSKNNSLEESFLPWLYFGFLCGLALFSRLCFRLFDYLEMKFVPKFRENIISSLFSHITKHNVSYFQNNFSGSIAHKIRQITDTSKEFLINFSSDLLQIFLVLIISVGLISLQSKALAGFILLFGCFYTYFSFLIAKKGKVFASNWSKENSSVAGKLIDSIENIFLVKSFSKEKEEIDIIKNSLEKEKLELINLKKFLLKTKFLHVIFSSFIIVGTIMYGVFLFLEKQITIGDLTLLYLYVTRLGGEFHALGDKITDFLEKYGILQESLDFIFVEQDNDYDKPDLIIKDGSISLKNISFEYKKGKNIFNDFSLEIKSNEKVALVGYSGSGKSTLTKIISKHFNVSKGDVFIDNKNIKDFSSNSINEQITHIQQEAYLFNRSIKENILYSKPEATKEELIEACEKAGCLSFILEKENGFDTIVGERGVQLSGGEKQRIALARAFLLKNPIFILDEPTSALDTISEKLIQESLKELIKNKTVIVIAHRLSTIINMDRILVMEKGKIIEEGTHDFLVNNSSVYKKLWNEQLIK